MKLDRWSADPRYWGSTAAMDELSTGVAFDRPISFGPSDTVPGRSRNHQPPATEADTR